LSLKLNNKELVDTMKPNFNLKIHKNTLVGMNVPETEFTLLPNCLRFLVALGMAIGDYTMGTGFRASVASEESQT
jgi:hypothetical protein